MVACVPSLENKTLLKDPQSIIAYQYKRYCRMPKDTMSILPDMIISLPYQVAQFGKNPSVLVTNIQSDLQGVYDRIFGTERKVTVNATQLPSGTNGYDITISITYMSLAGEIDQVGTTLSLNAKGQLVLPEDTLSFTTLS